MSNTHKLKKSLWDILPTSLMCHITGYKMDCSNYHRFGQIIYSVKENWYTNKKNYLSSKTCFPNIFPHLNEDSDNKYYFLKREENPKYRKTCKYDNIRHIYNKEK